MPPPWPARRLWAGLVLAVGMAHAWVLSAWWPAPAQRAPWPAQEPVRAVPVPVPVRMQLVPAGRGALSTPTPPTAAALAGGAPGREMPAGAPSAARPAAVSAARPAARPAATPGLGPAARMAAKAAVAARAADHPPADPDAGPGPAFAAPPRSAPPDLGPSGAALGRPDPPDPPDPADPAPPAPWGSAPPALPADPPPLYATRLPPSMRAVVRLNYLGRRSQASLLWQATSEGYQLLFDTAEPGAHPVMAQHSSGELGAHGLVPQRFVDRRRGRGARAANFRPDEARVSFSAAEWSLPAGPGTQDRLSWLLQLAGIAEAAAQSGRPLPEVQLWVVDARGEGALWRLQDQGLQPLSLPAGPLQGHCWQHQPERPDGLRVQACLDPARGHWPVQLRYTLLRTGGVIEWQLLDAAALP